MRKRTSVKLTASVLLCAFLFSACSGDEPTVRRKEGHSIPQKTLRIEPDILRGIPQELQDLAERNPETREFVDNYRSEGHKDHVIDLSEYEGCNTVPSLLQWDERWGYTTYNGKFFALTGCGPTCLSMVAIYLTGNPEYTPAWMGEFLDSHGYAIPDCGTAWSIFDDGIVDIGLYGVELQNNEAEITSNLLSGVPIICSMGPGYFTDYGHFVVFTGISEGKILVNDPNSRERTRAWSYEELEDQIVKVWGMYDYDEEL